MAGINIGELVEDMKTKTIFKLEERIIELQKENKGLKEDNKTLCKTIERLYEEIEKHRTTAREYEQRWLTSMGYYGVN